MNTIHWPSQNLPISETCDVLIAGGGTSGFIAAVAAARAGAKTILVEKLGYLGSCTTTPYNTQIGSFLDSFGDRIIGGIPYEFVKRMEAEGECVDADGVNPQIWPPTTKKVAMDMIMEAKVQLLLYTSVVDVITADGHVTEVIIHNKGGLSAIHAKAFVDATGDADLTALAKGLWEMTETENLQQVSTDLMCCGVDAEKVIQWAKTHPEQVVNDHGLNEHKVAGVQPMVRFVVPNAHTSYAASGKIDHIGVMPTVKLCVYRDAVRLQGNSDINPLDPNALSMAEVNGYYGALNHLKFLKETMPGFENAYIVSTNFLGVRETRRIVGEYMLSLDDVTSQSRYNDVVALNNRVLDYHLHKTVFRCSSIEGHHDVPLRALTPKGFDNLLVCGRSVSCDHLAQASLRGAATCMATGQAAGVAAAFAARGELGNVQGIQDTLQAQGAILHVG